MKKLFLGALLLTFFQSVQIVKAYDIIYGWNTQHKDEGVSSYACPLCRQRLNFVSTREWATFYYISIFPIGRKDFHFFCTHCGGTYPVPNSIDVAAILKEEAAKIPPTKFQLFKQKVWNVLKHPVVWGTPLAAVALKVSFDKAYQKYLEHPWGYATWSQEDKIAHVKKVLMYSKRYGAAYSKYGSAYIDYKIENYCRHNTISESDDPIKMANAIMLG